MVVALVLGIAIMIAVVALFIGVFLVMEPDKEVTTRLLSLTSLTGEISEPDADEGKIGGKLNKPVGEAMNRLVESGGEAGLPSAGGPVGERLEEDSAQLVRRTLDSLPSEQRRAIEMAFFGGLSQSEISELLGQPLGTIKARIRRGMLTLRDALEGVL